MYTATDSRNCLCKSLKQTEGIARLSTHVDVLVAKDGLGYGTVGGCHPSGHNYRVRARAVRTVQTRLVPRQHQRHVHLILFNVG
jgi:uncharacterized ParB-like nuclease family protein